jgi:hypothetical protein
MTINGATGVMVQRQWRKTTHKRVSARDDRSAQFVCLAVKPTRSIRSTAAKDDSLLLDTVNACIFVVLLRVYRPVDCLVLGGTAEMARRPACQMPVCKSASVGSPSACISNLSNQKMHVDGWIHIQRISLNALQVQRMF